MEVIALKRDSYVIEEENRLYLFNGKNMCKFDKKLDMELIKIINSFKIAKTKEELQRIHCLSKYQIDIIVEKLALFVEEKSVIKRILLLGKTKINALLFERLLNHSVFVTLLDGIDANDLSFFEITVLSQNIRFSPIYDRINTICKEKGSTILNIYFDNGTIIYGPYLQNNGMDSFCYRCFDIREKINNINVEEERIKSNIYKNNSFKDEDFFHLIDFKTAEKSASDILSFIMELKEFDRGGVYIWDSKNGINNLKYVDIYGVPFCENCTKKMRDEHMGNKLFNREETHLVDKGFIDIRYGVFRKMISSKTILNDAKIYYYTIQVPCIFNGINHIENGSFSYNVAGGVSTDNNEACGKAIGEAAERYCLEAYDISGLFKGSIIDIREKGGEIAKDIQLFSDWQYDKDGFPFVKLYDDIDIYWTKGTDLHREKEIYIPASYVYSRFKNVSEEHKLGYLTTSGTATSVDYKSAILYGIYELLERDSTMIMWLQKLNVPKVLINEDRIGNLRLKKTIELLRANHIEFDVYYITLDLTVPCFIAIGRSNNKALPSRLIGAGCRMNKDEALIRALEEIIQGCGWSSLQKEINEFNGGSNYENVKDFRDRVSLYAQEEMNKEFNFLRGNNTISYEDIFDIKCSEEEEYEVCRGILQENGLQTIVKKITTSDVSRIGFTVVKVIILGLQQIEANHNHRYLNCKRTIEVPLKLGYQDVALNSRGYNDAPHPFP